MKKLVILDVGLYIVFRVANQFKHLLQVISKLYLNCNRKVILKDSIRYLTTMLRATSDLPSQLLVSVTGKCRV